MSLINKIKAEVVLAPYTTFKIGGPAEFFVEVDSLTELVEALAWAKNQQKKIFILGGGSNVLISDAGFRGLVIKMNLKKIELSGTKLKLESGVLMSEAVLLALEKELTGLEWAVGLPGTVGGAIFGNASCYGSGMQDVVEELEYLDLADLQINKLSNQACGFAYHHSVFNNHEWLIISAVFALGSGNHSKMQKQLQEIIASGLTRQVKKPSPGCIFRNLSFAELEEANSKLFREALDLQKIRDGAVSAGWLIDSLDLKGKTIGGAKISEIHANFIVNESGKATASEVMMLISYIKQQVRDKYGVRLQEEIGYVGF